MLLLLGLLATDPTTAMMRTAADRSPAACADAACGEPPRRSPYRLDPNVDAGDDGKGVAVRTTGRRCAITGPTLCTRKPRTIYAASY